MTLSAERLTEIEARLAAWQIAENATNKDHDMYFTALGMFLNFAPQDIADLLLEVAQLRMKVAYLEDTISDLDADIKELMGQRYDGEVTS
jgi:hypothetical protein